MRVDAQFGSRAHRPAPAMTVVEAGHRADAILLQRGDDARKIVRISPHVAVGHHDDVMLDVAPHVYQVGNLVVEPVHCLVNYEIN